MNVLVIGSGGREHALVWAVSRSPSVGQVFATPGNAGTESITGPQGSIPKDISPSGFPAIARFCREREIDLVVVGPEAPLGDGIGDYLRDCGISVFGPGKEGAMLESSKSYAKSFMARHGIPEPDSWIFDDFTEAQQFLSKTHGPWVVKADGFAAGKGVSITHERDEAKDIIRQFMVEGLHGESGKRVVIEEFLQGREVTAMALVDGERFFPLPLSRDHKRVFDGNKGPNTGGMGAVAPVDPDLAGIIQERIIGRAVRGLVEDGIDYRGVLYAGIMITEDGPKVLEFNARFGDPEAQCVLPLLSGDFAQALLGCAKGVLSRGLSVKPMASTTVVLAMEGYPGTYPKGLPITGLGPDEDDAIVFHAGTTEIDGQIVTAGGRVLAVTALGPTKEASIKRAYEKAATIHFPGAFCRRDIGR